MAKVFEWERLDSGFVTHAPAVFFLIRIYWSNIYSDEVVVLKLHELYRY